MSNNDNDHGGKNVGLNTSNTRDHNSALNVNDGRNRMTNPATPDVNNVNNPPLNTPNTNNVRNVGYNRNFNDNKFTLSDDIANRVAGLKEVKSATVLLTEHTGNVAAVLD